MEKIDAISIPFYKFRVNDNLKQEIFDLVQTLPYKTEGRAEVGYRSDDFFHEELFNFFDESIKEVQNIYFKDELSFPIVDCWVNKYNGLNHLHRHAHPNSAICGVYYVTDHENLDTIFESRNPWNLITNSYDVTLLTLNKTFNPLTGNIKAEAGTLILFPPSLIHYMKTITKTKEVRYTIAFNTFPSGPISGNFTQILNIKALSLRDKYRAKNKK